MRGGRGAAVGSAARRQAADEDRRIPARDRGRAGDGVALSNTMPRYKLILEYDGAPFAGWQWQDDAPSVQRVLTGAIAAFCGHAVKVAGAGRTDAGVHAFGQVAHVDLEKDWRADRVRDAVNAHL